jgi:uncharacterized protein YndB with AHSA1/START domain
MTGQPHPADQLDRLGTVVREGSSVRLRFVRSYATSREDVWSALTDPDRLDRWFGRWTGDPAEGTVQVTMTAEDEQGPVPVTIRTCQPPELLELDVGGPEGAWPLTVSLTEADGRTWLTFVHELAEPYDAGSIGPGWQFYLDRLGAVLVDEPVPTRFEDYHPRLADRYLVPEA